MIRLEHGGQINHSVSQLVTMLPIDVTFDTGEETERGWKQKKTSLKIIIVVKEDIIEVRWTSQEIILNFKR